MTGFIDHLRLNRFAIGPNETVAALHLLDQQNTLDAAEARASLKVLLCGRRDEWHRFDDLFESYWYAKGRRRDTQQEKRNRNFVRPALWSRHLGEGEDQGGSSESTPEVTAKDARPGDHDATEAPRGVIATRNPRLMTTDLRHVAAPDEIAEAERLAFRLAAAIRYRLCRRYRSDRAGRALDLRRTIRLSVAQGGEPLRLARRSRPDRPVKIVVFLDVSGSMNPYSRFFLQFVKGLVCKWIAADAYLVHTRLVRVTDTLKDTDDIRAMARLALIAEGFGGGTRLGESMHAFNRHYAGKALDSRTVAIIVSDGYDTGSAAQLRSEIERLKRRVRRLVWLNPMLGWRDYSPATEAMSAVLPLVDHFAAAHTLSSLAAIEGDLARL